MTKPDIQVTTKELKKESEELVVQMKSLQDDVQKTVSQMRSLEKNLKEVERQKQEQDAQGKTDGAATRMTAYVMPDDDAVAQVGTVDISREEVPKVSSATNGTNTTTPIIKTETPKVEQKTPIVEAAKSNAAPDTSPEAPVGIRFVRRASDAPAPEVVKADKPASGNTKPANKSNNSPRQAGNNQQQNTNNRKPNYNSNERSASKSNEQSPIDSVDANRDKRKPIDPAKKANPQARSKNFEDNRGKTKKAAVRETPPSFSSDEDRMGSRKRRNNRNNYKSRQKQVIEPIKIEHAILTTERVTVKELSEKIGKPSTEIIKKLFLLGIMATINQDLDFDTAELIASEYDITLERNIAKTAEEVMTEAAEVEEHEEHLETRPPVVTIMGHVDHGKTSLLDAIRKARVTEGEAGGITQHIGAYTVDLNGRVITFLDTPGHEAFTAMRARGAQATDIAILVVAADDGIMPQTIEAINHAKAADVPIIVAINKIDKPEANPERIMQQLTEHGLVVEEWGGDIIAVPVSAKNGQGLDKLLEMILLVADVEELQANPKRLARGIIIEAQLDKGRGPVATVLIQNGTLRVGDNIVAGVASGRVRAMINDRGERVTEALPSYPVEVLGFGDVPAAGDIMHAVDGDRFTRLVAQERKDKIKADRIAVSQVSLDNLFSQIEAGQMKDLNVIIKADVQGSVEAMRQSLEKLSNDEVRVRAIHGGVGAITASDVNFAAASNAVIIGFNVRPNAAARDAAEKDGVDMRLYRVIYSAIEDIESAIKGLLEPVFNEETLGEAEVRDVFKVTGVGTIAGSYVKSGKIVRNASIRLVRDGIVIHEGNIISLRRFKDDVKEVASGYECGIGIENYNDIKEGDIIEAFEMIQIEQ